MSGNQVSGIVQVVSAKDGQYGKMYSVKVNGDWYGAGKFAPKCKEGDEVTFEFTYKGNYKNMEPRTLQVKAGNPASSGVPASAAGRSAGAGASSGSWDSRQETISRQAALNSAVSWMNFLHAEGAIPLPATAKGAKREGALRELLNQYTMEFYEQATGNKLVLKTKTASADGSEPEEDEGLDEATAQGW